MFPGSRATLDTYRCVEEDVVSRGYIGQYTHT